MTQLASKVASRGVGGRSRALDVDRYVSLRIRQRRIMLGLTQQQMAELIGVTPISRRTSTRRASTVWPPAGCTVLPKRWESKSAISTRDYRLAGVMCRLPASVCSWTSLAIS